MGTFTLKPHPDTPPKAIHGVEVRWFEAKDGRLILRWQVKNVDAIQVQAFAGRGRADGLWQTTCGELFLKDAQGNGYRELNFSPSGQWAAYRFTDYREGMINALVIDPPEISSAGGEYLYVLTVSLDGSFLEESAGAGLSMVIEETDGTKSYWALAHPPGKPDFHHPACFTLSLPAASAS